ncbi:hypothetical protein [Pseudoduganella namucuonensis]|uniref:Uncharacterized protein n=1 Tax=Pseudoduganella namucuonensis TaxID=1035707 RepID=A0A1I7JFF1_9BURK|nr:hypothetical protein [Pseudoduganella namucuonensis]SFU83915.1 hypothetical protein SAMN05216552_101188 [Pseudoduganella namucuonensis]
MQHDEPQRPAARPSLLSSEPAAAGNEPGILSDLDGGRKKKAAPASAPGVKRRRKGLVWGGVAVLVALLGGATAWVIDGPQSGTVLAQMEPAPADKLEPLSSPEDTGTVALVDNGAGVPDPVHAMAGAGEAATAAVDASAAAGAGASPAATVTPPAAAASLANTAAPPVVGASESAPGNSADIAAALAAPSLAKAAAAPAVATIQDAPAAEREQSLHEMLNGPAPVRKVAEAKPAETKAAKKKTSERDIRVAAQAKAKSSAPKLAKATTTRKKEAKPAPVKDNDVELLAALVAHTRPAKMESLASRLKQCRQLGSKGADQCRARACANAADDQQCKPPVSLAKETPEA